MFKVVSVQVVHCIYSSFRCKR